MKKIYFLLVFLFFSTVLKAQLTTDFLHKKYPLIKSILLKDSTNYIFQEVKEYTEASKVRAIVRFYNLKESQYIAFYLDKNDVCISYLAATQIRKTDETISFLNNQYDRISSNKCMDKGKYYLITTKDIADASLFVVEFNVL